MSNIKGEETVKKSTKISTKTAPKKKNTSTKTLKEEVEKPVEKIEKEIAKEEVAVVNEANIDNKARFYQRVLAYIIDALLIAFVATLITYPFRSESVKKVDNQIVETTQKALQGKIKVEAYSVQMNDLAYEKARLDGISNVVTILLGVIYYIVYQGLTKGQTLGKRLFKIKIVKNDKSELTYNDLILRNLLNNFIIFDILLAVFALIGKKPFLATYKCIDIAQLGILIVSVFMIAIRNDGRSIMDLVANTKVVRLEEK